MAYWGMDAAHARILRGVTIARRDYLLGGITMMVSG